MIPVIRRGEFGYFRFSRLSRSLRKIKIIRGPVTSTFLLKLSAAGNCPLKKQERARVVPQAGQWPKILSKRQRSGKEPALGTRKIRTKIPVPKAARRPLAVPREMHSRQKGKNLFFNKKFAVRILYAVGQNDYQINNPPYSAAPKGQEFEDSKRSVSKVKPVCAIYSQECGQDNRCCPISAESL